MLDSHAGARIRWTWGTIKLIWIYSGWVICQSIFWKFHSSLHLILCPENYMLELMPEVKSSYLWMLWAHVWCHLRLEKRESPCIFSCRKTQCLSSLPLLQELLDCLSLYLTLSSFQSLASLSPPRIGKFFKLGVPSLTFICSDEILSQQHTIIIISS